MTSKGVRADDVEQENDARQAVARLKTVPVQRRALQDVSNAPRFEAPGEPALRKPESAMGAEAPDKGCDVARDAKRNSALEAKFEANFEAKLEAKLEAKGGPKTETRREPAALHEQPLVSPNINKRPRSESMEVMDEAAMERKTRAGPGGFGGGLALSSSPAALSRRGSTSPSFIVRIALDPSVHPDQGHDQNDYEDDMDPQMCEEYADDIYAFMYETQEAYMVNPSYIEALPAGHRWARNRSTLLNWLVTVHRKFRLVAETLYLATNIIDRFLSTTVVPLEQVQLLAASALFVASKYEEVVTPAIANFAYVANASVEEIRTMEQKVLVALEFALGYPCPLNFLRRISRADDYDMRTRTVAKFMLEMSLFEPRLMVFRPSDVAAAAMFVARDILGMGEWTPSFVYYSGGCTSDGLAPIVEVMRDYLSGPCEQRDPEFVRQYMSKKVLRAALLATNWARDANNPDHDSAA